MGVTWTKYDYLYQRKGPWPQPSPSSPDGVAPSVVHVPREEQWRWQKDIGNRYLTTLATYWPVALARAVATGGKYPEVSDERFAQLLLNGIYTRFLCDTLDPVDVAAFRPVMDAAPAGSTWLKMDFTPVGGVRPFEGFYVQPGVVLVRQDAAGALSLAAIHLNDLVITPDARNAWDSAKYFVLQGAAYGILFTVHPNLHFPYDSVNAITKTAVPMRHLLFKILAPHLEYQLALNNAVLNDPSSVISNKQWVVYDPFTAAADDGLMSFFVAGYAGVAGNSAYPPFRWPQRPTPVRGAYGRFLDAYFEPFYTFAKTVTDKIDRDDPVVLAWARHIAHWIPGFPDETQIMEGDNLASAVAMFMWDVSLGHSVDHASFTDDVPMEEKCLRLRVPPPSSLDAPPPDRAAMVNVTDLARAYLAERIFFRPVAVTRLVDARYEFDDMDLNAAANRFIQDLREVEAQLKAEGIPAFIALDDVSASMQF